MKSFKTYLIEADYTRFLRKNKNLTNDQKEKINIFFKADKKAAKKYEKKWGWQSDTPQKMNWADFEDIMSMYNSGRRINLKSIKIQGKKGIDYWPMRIRSKIYVANIPLNRSTATYMNSCEYGNLLVNYCVGWADDSQYWNRHVIKEQKVPVYVIDGRKKWVVMIKEGNRKYEVWDKLNNRDVSIGDPEPIPNFSIKKELIGSKQSKLYDEIRLEFYSDKDTEDDHGDDEYDEQETMEDFFSDEIHDWTSRGNTIDLESVNSTESDSIDFLMNYSQECRNCNIDFSDDSISITGGKIKDIDFSVVDLEEVNIYKADIRDCQLYQLNEIDDCDISDSEINECNYVRSCDLYNVEVEDTKMDYMYNIKNCELKQSNIKNFKLMKNCNIIEGEFQSNSSDYKGEIDSCDFDGDSTISGCILDNSEFLSTNIDNCLVRDSKLFDCLLFECQIDDCDHHDGNVRKSQWSKGTWHSGVFETSVWWGGTFLSGNFVGMVDWNVWKGGTFKGGVFDHGKWEGGIWEDGKWQGGQDASGEYHEVDDSPDKW